MAVTYVTGPQRSGKSYFSVYRIYSLYKRDNEFIALSKANPFIRSIKCWYYYFKPLTPKKLYTHTYTNIDEFDLDFAPQLQKLVWDDFYRKLVRLHTLYLKGVTDEELNTLSKKLGLYDALFVVDEAHNYLRKMDDAVLWWITYHGHMHQDIHFISHNMEQIASPYKDNAIYYYRVASPLKAVSDRHFKIGSYETHKFYNKDHIKNIFIPIKDEVFSLYHSGQKQERRNTFKKFLYIVPLLLLLLVFATGFLLSSFDGEEHALTTEDNTTQLQESVSEDGLDVDETVTSGLDDVDVADIGTHHEAEVDYTSLVLAKVTCIEYTCTYRGIDFPLTFLKFYIEHYSPDYYDIRKLTPTMTEYTLLVDKDFERLLIRDDDTRSTQRSKYVSHSDTTDPISDTFFKR